MITLERAQRDGLRAFYHLPQFRREYPKFVGENAADLEMLWRHGDAPGLDSGCLMLRGELLWFQEACEVQVATSWQGSPLSAYVLAAVKLTPSTAPEIHRRHTLYQQMPWDEFVELLLEGWPEPALDLSQGEVVGWWGECRFQNDLMRSLYDLHARHVG